MKSGVFPDLDTELHDNMKGSDGSRQIDFPPDHPSIKGIGNLNKEKAGGRQKDVVLSPPVSKGKCLRGKNLWYPPLRRKAGVDDNRFSHNSFLFSLDSLMRSAELTEKTLPPKVLV
jgi:hypothetical protein